MEWERVYPKGKNSGASGSKVLSSAAGRAEPPAGVEGTATADAAKTSATAPLEAEGLRRGFCVEQGVYDLRSYLPAMFSDDVCEVGSSVG